MIGIAGLLIGATYALGQADRTWRSVLVYAALGLIAGLVLADAFHASFDPNAMPEDHFG